MQIFIPNFTRLKNYARGFLRGEFTAEYIFKELVTKIYLENRGY
jgi:hypothetical protein